MATKSTRESAKHDVITFKVDADLAKAMRGIANRSEFIREAVLQALDNGCPLCGGTGVLTPHQKKHWDRFLRTHEMRECDECHTRHPVCHEADHLGKPLKRVDELKSGK